MNFRLPRITLVEVMVLISIIALASAVIFKPEKKDVLNDPNHRCYKKVPVLTETDKNQLCLNGCTFNKEVKQVVCNYILTDECRNLRERRAEAELLSQACEN